MHFPRLHPQSAGVVVRNCTFIKLRRVYAPHFLKTLVYGERVHWTPTPRISSLRQHPWYFCQSLYHALLPLSVCICHQIMEPIPIHLCSPSPWLTVLYPETLSKCVSNMWKWAQLHISHTHKHTSSPTVFPWKKPVPPLHHYTVPGMSTCFCNMLRRKVS